MSIDVLRPATFLSERASLVLSSLAPKLLPALNSRLPIPYPLSLLTTPESQEKWTIHENLFISCLKTGDDESAFIALESLTARFGAENERIQVLRGLYREATAKTDAELETILKDYEEIVKGNETAMLVRKRRAALLKSMGRTQEAIKALVKIVDVSPVDAEAWAEIADMYAEAGSWERAVYCWEEVLLIMPNAWNLHARLAEVEWSWSVSTEENKVKLRLVASSMRRYCRSVELCDDYLKGYYGLKLTSTKLLELLTKPVKGIDSSGELGPPPQVAVESLNELATAKLSEIVRRGSAKEVDWDGYDVAELAAARQLLERDTQKVAR